MANEVVMPQMGADMTEGTLVKWLKKEGEQVERGEIIAEIETDKANVEIEAFAAGTLQGISAQEGDVVQVGEVMAMIAAEGEKVAASAGKAVAASAGASPREDKKASEQEDQRASRNGAATATRPDVEASGEVDKEEAAVGRGEAGEAAILEREEDEQAAEKGKSSPAQREDRAEAAAPKPGATGDGARAANASERIKVSPIARRMAEEKNIDLARVEGSGPEGRIVRRDVEAAEAQPRDLPETGPRPMVAPEPEGEGAPAPAAAPAPASSGRAVETTRMRGAIARRMSQSKQQAPHFYVTVDVDAAGMMEQRSRLNALLDEESKVSVNDILVKASAATLRRFPNFNGHYVDGQLRLLDSITISIGVALPDGLIAPSIADCDQKSLVEIAKASKDVAARARQGKIRPEEFDGSFTITNLGSYGVETLIGIINPPQVAILGVGAIRPAAVVKDGAVVPGRLMKLALSADHRAVDGANGGEFLAYLKQVLENPLLMA